MHLGKGRKQEGRVPDLGYSRREGRGEKRPGTEELGRRRLQEAQARGLSEVTQIVAPALALTTPV